MKTFKFFISILFISVLIVACSKDDSPPVITIVSPSEGSILIKGQTYPIVGTVSDDEELAEIDAGGIKITTFDSPIKHTFANLNLPIPTTATTGPGSFKVTATDKEGNKAEKVVNFTIQ